MDLNNNDKKINKFYENNKLDLFTGVESIKPDKNVPKEKISQPPTFIFSNKPNDKGQNPLELMKIFSSIAKSETNQKENLESGHILTKRQENVKKNSKYDFEIINEKIESINDLIYLGKSYSNK